MLNLFLTQNGATCGVSCKCQQCKNFAGSEVINRCTDLFAFMTEDVAGMVTESSLSIIYL